MSANHTYLKNKYILSIEDEEEIRDYVADLIQGTDGKRKHFIEELVTKWRKSCQPASEPLPLYRKKDDASEVPRPGDQAKRGRRKGRNKLEAPVYVEAEQPLEEVKTPLDLAKTHELNNNSSSKKKAKYVNLYTKEGQDKLAVMLPGRHPCECLAQKHKLINNCLTCGRIVCEQEGSGPCLFCGTLVR
ncbi:hypothetical protein JD844_014369 [Phrynosoma platyrhinos]|uniref:Zinc finger C2HC5-type domain-containing protein n=1 Tax=Phrynosoma platyrhinos TaxID=52577 RepID=A0ABQ7SRG3_PHRPL|nr:hypothetical protein JD844_014369 [Phrynosoma platyrhinos]